MTAATSQRSCFDLLDVRWTARCTRVNADPGSPDFLGGPDFEAIVTERLDTDFTPLDPVPEDEAIVVYTSGTSGRSKGASGSHASVSSNSRYNVRNPLFEPGDGYLTLAPIFHITGFICLFIAGVSGGARLIPNYRFDPHSFLDLLVNERPTYMAGPATAFTAMLAHPAVTPDHFSSFKRLMSGGAPLPEGLVTKFEERFGVPIGQGYGLTETVGQAAAVPAGLEAPVDPDSGNLSCGLPQPDTMIRILDDFGEPVGPGEIGEVAISGPRSPRSTSTIQRRRPNRCLVANCGPGTSATCARTGGCSSSIGRRT